MNEKTKKIITKVCVAAAVAANVPYYVKTTEDTVDIYALAWSFHKRPGEGDQDECVVNILQPSEIKAGFTAVKEAIQTAAEGLRSGKETEEPELILDVPAPEAAPAPEEAPEAPEEAAPEAPAAEE